MNSFSIPAGIDDDFLLVDNWLISVSLTICNLLNLLFFASICDSGNGRNSHGRMESRWLANELIRDIAWIATTGRLAHLSRQTLRDSSNVESC